MSDSRTSDSLAARTGERTKTQNERIEDGANALILTGFYPSAGARAKDVARAVLEAADAPRKPKWPTDESVNVALRAGPPVAGVPLDDGVPESVRRQLRAAMLVDPIMQVALYLIDDAGLIQDLIGREIDSLEYELVYEEYTSPIPHLQRLEKLRDVLTQLEQVVSNYDELPGKKP